MAKNDLRDNLNWLLLRASMVAKQRLIRVSEEYGLSPMQALTLCLIEPNDVVPMSMISELLSCDASNVTGIVERLSVGSYIERRECTTDRRVKTITLTTAGNELRGKILPLLIENDTALQTNLTPEETQELKNLLTKTLPVAVVSKHFESGAK